MSDDTKQKLYGGTASEARTPINEWRVVRKDETLLNQHTEIFLLSHRLLIHIVYPEN